MLILVAFPFISMAIMPCMHYITINFSWLVVLLPLIADTQANSSVPTAFHWFILQNDALTGLFIMLTPVKRGNFDTSSNVMRDLFDPVELITIYRQCTCKHEKKESHLACCNQLAIKAWQFYGSKPVTDKIKSRT